MFILSFLRITSFSILFLSISYFMSFLISVIVFNIMAWFHRQGLD